VIKFTRSLEKIKKGNITGKMFKVHTLKAFKQDFEQRVGLRIKKMHIVISKITKILFAFNFCNIYNNIRK